MEKTTGRGLGSSSSLSMSDATLAAEEMLQRLPGITVSKLRRLNR
jgi:hypothetical protein